MFWQSTFAMTVVDVLVMSIAGYTLRVLYRHRVDLRVRRAISGALLIALGVALFGAFYSVDLFTMHGLPLLIPREDAITAMRHLHLDVNWLVTIAAMASIVVGFLLNNRKLLSLIGRLESTQSGLVEEVAERKQAEEALQHSKRRLASAHHVAKLAHWDRHPKDDRLVFSRNAAFILGVSSDELPDHNSRLNQQFVHPEDRADHMATTDQPFYEAVDYELQYRIIRPDGEVRHIFEIAEVVFDDSGQRVGMSGTIQDITEREQIKEALDRKSVV